MSKITPIKKQIKININDINWTQVTGKRSHRTKLDEIRVNFWKSGEKLNCLVYIGENIVEKIKWKKGDRIGIFFNPDDVLQMMLAKCSTGNSMARVKTNAPFSVRLANIDSIIKDFKPRYIPDFQILGDRIVFRLE
jgi:hypothetical protein